MVNVITVRNSLDPFRSQELCRMTPGLPVQSYVNSMFLNIPTNYEIAVSLDGHPVEDMSVCVSDEQSLAMIVIPQGGRGGSGNSGGKLVARIVGMIVIAAVSYGVGAAVAGAAWAGATAAGVATTTSLMVAGVVSATINIVGALLLNAILPVSANTSSGAANSPTYGWGAGENAVQEGSCLPVLYGTHRVTPPRIDMYINMSGQTQTLGLLFAVTGHPIDAISDVRINETSDISSNFPDVVIETTLGLNNNPVMSTFGEASTMIVDHLPGNILDLNWRTFTTQGDSIDSVELGFLFYMGMFGDSEDDQGQYQVAQMIQVQYCPTGTQNWKSAFEYTAPATYVSSPRWSLGYREYSSDRYSNRISWVEVNAGSQNYGDHIEGQVEASATNWQSRYAMCHFGDYPDLTWKWISWERIVPYTDQDSARYAFLFEGNTTSPLRYVRALPRMAKGRYDFRLKLFNDACLSSKLQHRDVNLEFYKEIISDYFSFPGVSLLAFHANATSQLSTSIPRISCLASRLYVYVYDPSVGFLQKSARNPAWACYDILCGIQNIYNVNTGLYEYTNTGPVNYSKVIFDDFEDWALYLDSIQSSTYPYQCKYTCDIYFDQTQTLRKALDIVGLLGSGVVVQQGCQWTCIVDKPEKAGVQRFSFNMSNIEENSFNETWLPMDNRCNSLEITYYDKDYDYQATTVEVKQIGYDESENEIKQTTVDFRGCTTYENAVFYAKYLLNCNRYLTLTCSFTAFTDSIACYPGQLIEVQHDVPQYGYGGRLLTGSTWKNVILDRNVEMLYGDAYEYYIVIYNQSNDYRWESKIVKVPGITNTLELENTPTISYNILCADSKFSFGEINKMNKLMRVLSITYSSDTRRKISCIEFINDIFTEDAEIRLINTSSLPPYTVMPPLQAINCLLIWTFNVVTKIWYPYLQLTPVYNNVVNYAEIMDTIANVRIYLHQETGDTTGLSITPGSFETVFNIGTGVYNYSADLLLGNTVYVTATVIDSQSVETAPCQNSILFLGTQTLIPSLTLDTQLDIAYGINGYSYYNDTYAVNIKWNPAGWVLINNTYTPILTLNDGNNYYAFNNHLVLYGIVNAAGDYPLMENITTIATVNIGDIYDVNGVLITDSALLNSICTSALSYRIDGILYATTYVAIATVPVLKTGETCNLDWSIPGYGLDWAYAYADAPGSGSGTIEEIEITGLTLTTTMQDNGLFQCNIEWSTDLLSIQIDGFVFIYRSQPDLWSWNLSIAISSIELQFETLKSSLDTSTGGGIMAYNSFTDQITRWLSTNKISEIYIVICDAVAYEIIEIDLFNASMNRGIDETVVREWGIGCNVSYLPCEYIDSIEYISNPNARAHVVSNLMEIGSALHCSLIATKKSSNDPGYIRSKYALLSSVSNT